MSDQNLDHFLENPQAFEALSETEQNHLLEHGQLPAQGEQPAAQAAPEVQQEAQAQPAESPQAEQPAAQPSAEEAQAAQAQADEGRKGNPEVPLRQLREQARQLTEHNANLSQQLAQHQALMSNPQALQQLLAQHQPPERADFLTNPEAYITQAVQQTTAPLMQTIQQLQAQNQAQQQQAHIQALSQRHPDLQQTLALADAQAPHLAQQYPDPEARYLMVKGAQAADPTFQQQQVQAAAQKIAEQMVSEKLQAATGGQKQLPVTLGGLPAGKSGEAPRDILSMPFDEFNKLSDDDISKMKAQF